MASHLAGSPGVSRSNRPVRSSRQSSARQGSQRAAPVGKAIGRHSIPPCSRRSHRVDATATAAFHFDSRRRLRTAIRFPGHNLPGRPERLKFRGRAYESAPSRNGITRRVQPSRSASSTRGCSNNVYQSPETPVQGSGIPRSPEAPRHAPNQRVRARPAAVRTNLPRHKKGHRPCSRFNF